MASVGLLFLLLLLLSLPTGPGFYVVAFVAADEAQSSDEAVTGTSGLEEGDSFDSNSNGVYGSTGYDYGSGISVNDHRESGTYYLVMNFAAY